MQGLKIKDSRKSELGRSLNFDLKEIFAAIGDHVIVSTWKCHNVECIGKNTQRLHELSEEDRSVSGTKLVEIVQGISQTIDGEFEAYRDGQETPWLVVNAVDSSWFEVLSFESSVLERVSTSFQDVSPLPPSAA